MSSHVASLPFDKIPAAAKGPLWAELRMAMAATGQSSVAAIASIIVKTASHEGSGVQQAGMRFASWLAASPPLTIR